MSGYRESLVREARDHAEHYRSYDDTEALVSTLVEMANMLAADEPSDQVKQLLRDITDPDDCWFDHHGGCQAHGYLSLQPGEKCPHAEAKELLASWVPMKQEGAER